MEQQDTNERPELSQSDLAEYCDHDYFKMFDKNGDDQLDKNELRKVFVALCWKPSEKEFDELFATADKDGKGYVNYEEYKTLLKSFGKDSNAEDLEMRELFRHFDKDKNGILDLEEMKRFLLSRGIFFNERESHSLEKSFKKVNKKGDGKINYDEFVEMMKEQPYVMEQFLAKKF